MRPGGVLPLCGFAVIVVLANAGDKLGWSGFGHAALAFITGVIVATAFIAWREGR